MHSSWNSCLHLFLVHSCLSPPLPPPGRKVGQFLASAKLLCSRPATQFETALRVHEFIWVQAYLLAALKQPGACINDLPLLAPEDRNAIIIGFNATSAQFPSGYCVHELFENQVEENPAAICLALRKLLFSYGDVEALANRLATHLVQLGAGTGVPIGLMMSRCPEMYIAMLAILKVSALRESQAKIETATPDRHLLFHNTNHCQVVDIGSRFRDPFWVW